MFRILFLCTGNSARSQMAEALLNWKGKGRFEAHSAGSRPAAQVNPFAIATLREHGIPWAGHAPRGIDGLEREPWDFVVTVCDRAKEACPIFPGQPILAHWGMPDSGDENAATLQHLKSDDARATVLWSDTSGPPACCSLPTSPS